MKALFVSLILMNPAAHAANLNYGCTAPGAQLHVHTIAAEGPADLVVDYLFGEGTRNAGGVTFTGSSVPSQGVYALEDGDGHTAQLVINEVPLHHFPCGRAGCDFDGATKTVATLTFEGNVSSFTCH